LQSLSTSVGWPVELERRDSIGTVGHDSVNPKVHIKRVLPVLGGELSAIKHSSNHVANGGVWPFATAIMRGRASASGLHNVVMLHKESCESRILPYLSTQVKMNGVS
jgi:hypothetical protein